jgi:hypothetical protein
MQAGPNWDLSPPTKPSATNSYDAALQINVIAPEPHRIA